MNHDTCSNCHKSKLPHLTPWVADTRNSGIEDNILHQKLKDEVRAELLQEKTNTLISKDDFRQISDALGKYSNSTIVLKPTISYENFKRCHQSLPAKFDRFFAPSVFFKLLSLKKFSSYNLDVTDFCEYVSRKSWYEKASINLTLYDLNGMGFVTEGMFESYITDLVNTSKHFEEIEESFMPYYVCAVVRKFCFLLDKTGTGVMAIKDILLSGLLQKLTNSQCITYSDDWFSMNSMLNVYNSYLACDVDNDGMLSLQEFKTFRSITSIFAERVYQICPTFSGDLLDFRLFLSVILAMDNASTCLAGMKFMFKIIDIRELGWIERSDLKVFVSEIISGLEQRMLVDPTNNDDKINVDDVIDELFDMLGVNCNKITLNHMEDKLKKGRGGSNVSTFFSILIDVSKFWSYENREDSLLIEQEDESPSYGDDLEDETSTESEN